MLLSPTSEHILRWGLRGKKQVNNSSITNTSETVPTSGLYRLSSSRSRTAVRMTASSPSSRSRLHCRLLGGVLLSCPPLRGAPVSIHSQLEPVFYLHGSVSCHWGEFYLFVCVAALSLCPTRG